MKQSAAESPVLAIFGLRLHVSHARTKSTARKPRDHRPRKMTSRGLALALHDADERWNALNLGKLQITQNIAALKKRREPIRHQMAKWTKLKQDLRKEIQKVHAASARAQRYESRISQPCV